MLPEGKKVCIGEQEFHFSIANTARELLKGLAGVASLEPYDGMLFDFGLPWRPIMTPKGLKFPVDLAFITSQGKVVEIHRLDPEYGFTQSTIRTDVRYALEVPVGFFDLHGISIGDVLSVD